MISPEASDFAWISVVKPPRERPSACFLAPSCPDRRHMRAHDGGIEHLNEMRRSTHGCKRVEERLEDAGLAQAIEAFHTLFQGPKRSGRARQERLDGEEMQRLEEAAIVLGLASAPRQASAKHRSVCAQSFSSIFVDIGPGLLIGRSPINHG